MQRHVRTGFTMFELLVVLAILGFLLGLLLPLLQRVRAAAARTQSMNNLKQLALACHNYHDAYRKFPAGNDANGFSASAHMLPYVEQDGVYRQIDFKVPATARANAAARRVQIKTFISPLDPVASQDGFAGSSYLYSAGSKYALENNDGVCYQNSATSFVHITDGTSNTVMIGETLAGDGAAKATTVQRQHVVLGKDALGGLNQGSGVQDFQADKNVAANRATRWIEGRFLQGTFTGTRQVNDTKPDVDCDGAGGLSGLRNTQGGTNVALCDGSVRFVTANVSLQTWHLVTARGDGNAIPQDWGQ